MRRVAPFVVLAALVAAPYVVANYATVMLTRILVIGLLAVTVAVLTGIAGLPTLGQTAPFAIGAYTGAQLLVHGTTIGVVQLLAAAGAGAVFALITAPLVVYARGVVVLMITLALGELASIAAGRLKSLTGGTDGLVAFTRIRPLPGLVELDTDRAVYLYVLAVVAVAVAIVVLLMRSRFGTLLRASRDNEARMRASGHPVTWYLTLVYVFAGALAGVAGSLLVAVDQYVSPDDSGFSLSALVLLAVVIGGATSMTGAFFGAALVVVTRDWLAGAGQAPLVLGAVFVVCVYLLPQGLFSPLTASVFTRGRFSKASSGTHRGTP